MGDGDESKVTLKYADYAVGDPIREAMLPLDMNCDQMVYYWINWSNFTFHFGQGFTYGGSSILEPYYFGESLHVRALGLATPGYSSEWRVRESLG